MQRAGVESILSVTIKAGVLHLAPCIPKAWPGFEVSIRYRSARYVIAVENPNAVSSGIAEAEVDGQIIPARPLSIPLLDDGAMHQVKVRLG